MFLLLVVELLILEEETCVFFCGTFLYESQQQKIAAATNEGWGLIVLNPHVLNTRGAWWHRSSRWFPPAGRYKVKKAASSTQSGLYRRFIHGAVRGAQCRSLLLN